ncbi:MAG: energy-coupling factor transporter ATPase [Anaerolineaceae bacterium]|nr:energy-coupling factor transporter ATPase [Anaerolineaceae bacterium]
MDTIIDIRGLAYGYRGHEDNQVLGGIDLDIAQGEFLAIAGRTGSGKSTLCYAMMGLVPHSFGGRMEGMVKVCGLDTRDTTPAKMAYNVGIVLQSAESQLVGLTVEEDVQFGLENIALPVPNIIERSRHALEVVHLTPYIDSSPWNLSGGQKQRLAIASALAFQPKILILDNPTAELDPLGKEEVLETIARLNRELGITIIIVDQELQEIIPYAHRILILEEGKILSIGTPAEVLDQGTLLHEAGVKLPDVTEIGYQLRKKDCWAGALPITVEEACQKFQAQNLHPGNSIAPAAQPAAGQPLVQIENLSFHYPNGKIVLKGIDLTIHQGEFITLMGQNGTGKTTLAKHLNGLLKPSSGKVVVEGMDTLSASISILATKVGYVFQNPDHQIFSKSVEEELSFGPQNLGWPPEMIQTAVASILKDIGMEGKGKAEPYFMGLAERKLIAIASVLIMHPDILVLDEPATGADYGVALRIMRYISDLHHQGLTVVIITHDVSLAANYATRLVVMNEGCVVLDGSPPEVFGQHETLRQCHISVPQVVDLSERLYQRGLPSRFFRVQDLVNAF